jgi:hypothetical protein
MASSRQPAFSHEAENFTMTTYFNSDEDFSRFEIEKQIEVQKNTLTTSWHQLYIPRIKNILRSLRFSEQFQNDYYCHYITELKPKLNLIDGNLKIDIWANDPLMYVAHREGFIIADPLQGDYPIDFDYIVPFCDPNGMIAYSYIPEQENVQRPDRVNNADKNLNFQNLGSNNLTVKNPIDFSKTIHYLGYRDTISQQMTAALVGINQIISANVKMPLTVVNLQIVSPNVK